MGMESKRPGLWGPIITLLLITGGIVWWVTSLTNDDMWWFLRSFTAKADWIVIYWDGETTILFPGDAGYEEIMAVFSDGVAHWSGYEGAVGLSDENLERYRTEWQLLELYYNKPVNVHTQHLYPKARTFFIPLSGTHAEWRRVFAGLTDKPRAGVLNLSADRFGKLSAAVKQVMQP
jgi:hypothetical protein